MANPKFTIDAENQTAHLDLFVGGVFITSYAYANGVITLSERENIDVVPFVTLKENVSYIKFFIGSIVQQLSPQDFVSVIFKEEIERENGTMQYKQELAGEQTIDVEYNYTTQQFTFQPRAEIELNFRQFKYFHHALQNIIILAERTD